MNPFQVKKTPEPPVPLLKTNLDFLDRCIHIQRGKVKGIPTNSWIVLAGPPGSGKTTLGISILDGLGSNLDVVTEHLDWEMGEDRAAEVYKSLGITKIRHYLYRLEDSIVPHITGMAKACEASGNTYVVMIDSFDYPAGGDTARFQKLLAEKLEELKNKHRNLIIITVNHENKKGQVAGASQIQRMCDVVIRCDRTPGTIRVLKFPKNRYTPEDSPESVKFYFDRKKKKLLESVEPDFVTNNPLVQGIRKLNTFLNTKLAPKG